MKRNLIAVVLLAAIVLVACGGGGEAQGPVEVKMGRADYAAHGKQAWANVVVAMDGDTIVGVSLDEYQFLPMDEIVAGVPNSEHEGEKTLALNFADPNKVPASKRVNDDYYSGLMTEIGGATVTIAGNFDAIEEYCTGKTVAELEELVAKSNQDVIDAISGATVVDAKGYVEAVIAAAKAAK